MVCVHCGAKTHVINSRSQLRNNQVWRRRKCWDCETVFTTEEKAHYGQSWAVKDRHEVIQPFSRDKLLLSIYKSCQHRPHALTDASALVETIIRKLPEHLNNGLVDRRAIAQICQVTLNRFDAAASAHYGAFHA